MTDANSNASNNNTSTARVHILPSGGKQCRSAKADDYAAKLARELRDLTRCGSAHEIAKYSAIDDILDAIAAARRGETVKIG